ncbi:hypothetical protein B0A49_13445, partial [Cryomyces minteri]
MKKTIWQEDCRSWYKNNSASARVSALWPGSTLHYIEMMRETRYEDWDFKYDGNRFAFMGNGYSQTELDPTCDLGYYIRTVDDGPYSSRDKRRRVITKSGSKTAPIANPVQWAPENSGPSTRLAQPEKTQGAARLASENYKKVLQDIESYEAHLNETDYVDAKEFEQAVQQGKSKRVPKKSSYTVSFPRQVWACTLREFRLIFGDTTTLYTKLFIIISNGLIVGSLFYGQPLNTEGAFSRGGSAFFSILFLGWLQLTELMKAVSGRAVVARHKDYAFYRPSAVSIARVVTDIPILFVQVVIFGVIMYFLTGLDVDVSKFWIYLLFVYVTTFCITALYRMFASLSPTIDDAVRFSGIALNLLVIYTGYVIPKTQLLSRTPWFGWLNCGAAVNAHSVDGAAYLQTTYSYTRSNLWRNFGVVIAFTVLYILVTALATELFLFASSGGGALIFKKSKKAKKAVQDARASDDEEKATPTDGISTPSSGGTAVDAQAEEEALQQLEKSESVFTWENVEYTVPYNGGERKLLNKVNG